MMNLNWKQEVLGLLAVVVALGVCNGAEESSTCLMIYKNGGAASALQSPLCSRWNLPPSYGNELSHDSDVAKVGCQSATLQGRRKYQEDRLLCVRDIPIPFSGKEVVVDIVAVFDGHNGYEASEMASKLLLKYFGLHTYFLSNVYNPFVTKKDMGMLPATIVDDVVNWTEDLDQYGLNFKRSQANINGSFHLEILKEALRRTIHDIDDTFSKEAAMNDLISGSTAAIALIVDDKILVAHVGDSKVLLCSKRDQSYEEARAAFLRSYSEQRRNSIDSSNRRQIKAKLASNLGKTHFAAEELTRDHHPDRLDERTRVENSGGFVSHWSVVPRVNGQLAVSRSIGDVYFKKYGVIQTPEVTEWRPITANDSYLVVASDGVFEKMSSQDVCDKLWEEHDHDRTKNCPEFDSSCSPHSLADSIANTAFEKGSMDNIAAAVVSLSPTTSSSRLVYDKF